MVNNFGGLEEKYTHFETSKVVILPIPYDGTSTWLKGADKGPDAIIDASINLEFYDIELDIEPYTVGIHTLPPLKDFSSPEEMAICTYNETIKYLPDKFVICIGGEHSISYGPIKAHVEKFDDITVLQLDAHTDLRDEYNNSKYNHACVMARVKELCPIVHVGIRSQCVEELNSFTKENIFFAHEIRKITNWTDKVVNAIKTKNVYITIDLDVFDPSIMPSTGTPEPGGLTWYDVIDLLEKVFKNKNVVGVDVVELCPNEYNKAPDFLAAKLIYKIIGFKFFLNK
jgi:agmatinase